MARLHTLRHRATFPVTKIAMVLITVQAVVAVVANIALVLVMAAAMAVLAQDVVDVCKDSHIHAPLAVRHLLAVRLLGLRVSHHLRHAVGPSQSARRSPLSLLSSSRSNDLQRPRLRG